MSFIWRKVAHCDLCGHEWLAKGVPVHCAKCKRRTWNLEDDPLAEDPKPVEKSVEKPVLATRETPAAPPNIQLLRDIAAGKIPAHLRSEPVAVTFDPPCPHFEWINDEQVFCRFLTGHKGKCQPR